MKKHTDPLLPETYYHVYNRGINGENIFKEPRNYDYFLSRYFKYIPPIAETYAYCLLKNHFHIMIRIRHESEILSNLEVDSVINAVDLKVSKLISKQFGTLFNSYAQSINKAHDRTGGLFERPFRRVPITTNNHFTSLILYIHTNACKHGFVSNFKRYPHSSYHLHLSNKPTQLEKNEVLNWFGGKDIFIRMHEAYESGIMDKNMITFEH